MQCVPSFPVTLGVLIVKLGTCIIFFLGPAFCCEKPPPGCYSNILFWGSTFVGILISQSNSAPGCVNVGRLRKFWRLITPKGGFKPMQLATKFGHLYHPFPWALCCENLLGCFRILENLQCVFLLLPGCSAGQKVHLVFQVRLVALNTKA
jgi:hypothetical protein